MKAWVAQRARNFLIHIDHAQLPTDQLVRDRDGKYASIFDTILESNGVKVKKRPIGSPNLNAFAERFLQTPKHECLNHFVILGRKPPGYLVATFVDDYHTQRPPRSRGNETLLELTGPPPNINGGVSCEERLGGLLTHCYRKEA